MKPHIAQGVERGIEMTPPKIKDKKNMNLLHPVARVGAYIGGWGLLEKLLTS